MGLSGVCFAEDNHWRDVKENNFREIYYRENTILSKFRIYRGVLRGKITISLVDLHYISPVIYSRLSVNPEIGKSGGNSIVAKEMLN